MSATHYRSDIQGLRAIAVLAVMLFHYNPAWLPGGFVGVDVFFVISGYLIVRILLQKKAKPDYRMAATLRYFYTSRLKRIAPAYFAMLVLVSLMAAVLLVPQDFAIYKKGLNQAAWFYSNSYFAVFGDYFAPASYEQPLLHTWSLAVEIQFYLLAPFLVLMLSRRALKWVLFLLFIGLTIIAQYRLSVLNIHQATYYSLYARLPEFFVGGLVAVCSLSDQASPRRWPAIAGLGLILTAAVLQPQLGPFPGLSAFLPVAGASLILWHPSQGFLQRVLSNYIMVWVGQLSYSFYLWHWPVLALMRYYTGDEVLDTSSSLLFITFTLLLTTWSFYCIEEPLRASGISVRQRVGYGLLACVLLITAPNMAKLNQALSLLPLPIEYRRYADPATICHGKIVGDCLKGDLSSDKEVLVLGDSHAAMLNLFFDKLGNELGFKARIITASSCVNIAGFDVARIADWARTPCMDQIDAVNEYLPNAKLIFVAGNWSAHLNSTEFKRALNVFLAKKNTGDSKVYLMEQVPLLNKKYFRSLRWQWILNERRVEVESSYKKSNFILQDIASSYGNAKTLNFESSGIFIDAPRYQGEMIYMDHHHLNELGSKIYANAAFNMIKEIADKIK